MYLNRARRSSRPSISFAVSYKVIPKSAIGIAYIYCNDKDQAQTLVLDRRADIGARDYNGPAALPLATEFGDASLVFVLIPPAQHFAVLN